MALRFSPLASTTGQAGLIQQPVTPDYSILAKKLEEARRALMAPDTANTDRPGHQTQVNDLQRALVAGKDQSRLDQLPPGPMPPPGDVTVIEKGAVQERPPSSFGALPTEDQIMQAFQRRQQQAAPPEMMVAEASPAPTNTNSPTAYANSPKPYTNSSIAPAPAAVDMSAPRSSGGGVAYAPNTARSGLSEGALGAMKRLESSWGRPITVTSAYRSPEHNAKVGGAKHSQHMHGNAFDISTDGWTDADKQAFVDQALAAGFNGIGVYPNSLHIDVGSRRAWGPSYGRESAPEWALAKVNGAPATDQNWITGGESAQPSALAFNAEDGMQLSAGGPQDGLMRLLSAMRQPQAEPQGQYVPMEQPQAYTEVAQGSQPIVAPGSNVKPVSFSGDGAGAIRSPEQIDNTRQLAAALMSPGAQRVDHPLQGVAQVANAAAGAYGMHRANQQEQQRANALAQALQAAYNGNDASGLAAVAPNLYSRFMEQKRQSEMLNQRDQAANQEWRNREKYKRELDQQYAPEPVQYEDVIDPNTGQVIGQRNPQTNEYKTKGTPTTTNNISVGGKDLPTPVLNELNARTEPFRDLRRKLTSIDDAQQALMSGEVITGAAAPTRLQLARFGAMVGITDPEMVANTDVLLSTLAGQTLQEMNLIKGVASESDRVYAERAAGGDVQASAEAIGRILDIRRRNLRLGAEQHNAFMQQLIAANPTLESLAPLYMVDLPEEKQGGMEGDGQTQADGPTATNPQTGQKLILRNGQWVPIDG